MPLFETATQYDRRTRSRHMQGIGRVPAKPAIELEPGDVTIWNYGYTYIVEDVDVSASAKLVSVVMHDAEGRRWTRTFGARRMVGVVDDE